MERVVLTGRQAGKAGARSPHVSKGSVRSHQADSRWPSVAPPTSLPAPPPLSRPMSLVLFHKHSTLTPTSGPLFLPVSAPGIFFPKSSHGWILLIWPSVQMTPPQKVPPCLKFPKGPLSPWLPPRISLPFILFLAHLSYSPACCRPPALECQQKKGQVTRQSWFLSRYAPAPWRKLPKQTLSAPWSGGSVAWSIRPSGCGFSS